MNAKNILKFINEDMAGKKVICKEDHFEQEKLPNGTITPLKIFKNDTGEIVKKDGYKVYIVWDGAGVMTFISFDVNFDKFIKVK